MPLVDAKAEFDGVQRRARAVSGNVGYAIARLWLRSPIYLRVSHELSAAVLTSRDRTLWCF